MHAHRASRLCARAHRIFSRQQSKEFKLQHDGTAHRTELALPTTVRGPPATRAPLSTTTASAKTVLLYPEIDGPEHYYSIPVTSECRLSYSHSTWRPQKTENSRLWSYGIRAQTPMFWRGSAGSTVPD